MRRAQAGPLMITLLAFVAFAGGCASGRPKARETITLEGRLDRGSKLLAAKDYPSAIREFELVLKKRPDNLRAHLGLGLTYLHTTYYEGAEAQFNKALEIDPNSAEAHYGMGAVKFQQGYPDEAEPHFAKAIDIYPDYALAHYSLGVIWEKRGKDERAREHYEQAVSADPGLREALFNLGMLYSRNSMFVEAISTLVEVRALAPDSVPTRLALAELYRKTGQHEASLEEIAEAEKLASPNAMTFLQSGLTLLALDRIDEAEDSFRRGLDLEQDDTDLLLGLAEAQLRAESFREAELTVRQVLDKTPSSSVARFKLGVILAAMNRNETAVEELQKALQLDPDPPLAKAIAKLLERLGSGPAEDGEER